jgi:hypothetical protein
MLPWTKKAKANNPLYPAILKPWILDLYRVYSQLEGAASTMNAAITESDRLKFGGRLPSMTNGVCAKRWAATAPDGVSNQPPRSLLGLL